MFITIKVFTTLREHRVFRLFQPGLIGRPIARRAYLGPALVCAVVSSIVVMLPSMTFERHLKGIA